MKHLSGSNLETTIHKKIKYVFEFVPIILMLFIQAFVSSEYISFSNRDYCSSFIQIIIVDTSVNLCSYEKLTINSISVDISVLILIISSVMYVILQTPLFDESKGLIAYITIFIMIIITIVLKAIESRKRIGEEKC